MRFSVRDRAQSALFLTCANVEPPHAKAHSAQTVSRKSAVCNRRLTEKRILYQRRHRDVTERRTLDGRRHGKAHSAAAPHQKAHSACERWLCREAIFAGLCTLLHTHGRSRDRAGPRVPRHRRPHGPCDAQVPGPEVYATGAVTQPPTHTNSRSLRHNRENRPIARGSSRGKHSFCVSLTSSP